MINGANSMKNRKDQGDSNRLRLMNPSNSNGKVHFLVHQWAVIFMCIWISWPYLNYQLGILPFLVLFVCWFFLTDFKWVFHYLSIDIVMLIVWGITLIPFIFTGDFEYGSLSPKNALVSFLLFFTGMIINHYYMYYKKNPVVLGRVVFITLLFYFIASIQTYFGLKQFPFAARELATGMSSLPTAYYSLGIGGFGFVYSAVFINILLLYFIFNKQSKGQRSFKILCLLIFCMITAMLVLASYATALLFLFIGSMLVLFIRGKRSFILAIFLSSLFLLIVPKEIFGQVFIHAAYLFDGNGVIQSKLFDLAQGFVSGNYGDQTVGRGQLYLSSIHAFLHNPFFGIYGPFSNPFNTFVGGHSGWLDQLAYYGLFGSFPLFTVFFLNIRKHLQHFSKHPYYRILLIAQLLFILFGFINPVLYIYQLGFVMFVIAPAIPYLPYAFSKKEQGKD